MATDAASEDFVTIVPVGEGRPSARDPSFVTVLTVGAAAGAAEVVVRRPRGDRLGLGLKFEGGSAAAEKVRRLLVQSCAEDSPAANAQAPWGKLIPGDEILAIDGTSVSELTRIDCVRRLKDSDETLKLLVRHFETETKSDQSNMDVTDSVPITKQTTEIVRPTTLPPPVPPRKLGKKNSFKDKQFLQTIADQNGAINTDGHLIDKEGTLNGKFNGISTITKLSRKSSFDSHIHRQNKEGLAYFKKGSPEEVRRLVRRLSDGKAMPPEAEVYIDLLSTEWERCLVLADAESDDTGSSISTVVDRLGSMASSVESSIPSTPTMQPKTIDIQKVLNCIENIDTNILKDMTSKRFLEKQNETNNEMRMEKHHISNGFSNHDPTPQTVTESSKKIQHNDNNNNNTAVHSVMNDQNGIRKKDDSKLEQTPNVQQTSDKPKPMPRNTKIERSASERKPRPVPVPSVPPPPVPDSLLTPTKKNCIESWLQRSEAEMNNKNVEKIDEVIPPEALPRLIDFVPKPQFKEPSDSSLARPTAPPPPPPAETREDGSGASLDTIGELDETSDVTDNVKPNVITETKERKSVFERSFWEDRIPKSDAEDKSLSNDETPPPTCPRQPPDGVETPAEAVEKVPEPASRGVRLPAGWPITRSRYSYSSRTQDARSEASVKDKIAMFSNDHATSTDRLDKCGTLPTRNNLAARKSTSTYTSSYSDISSLDRRLTKSQDNLDELPRSYIRHVDRPTILGAPETQIVAPCFGTLTSNNRAAHSDIKPLFYGSTTTLPMSTDTSFAPPIYHARSVSDDNGKNKSTLAHKSNLEYLIEQRKKAMSKLRGLAIPEVQAPIVDLPEIKVQDSLSKTFLLKNTQPISNNKNNKPNNPKPMKLNESAWKTPIFPNNIPKYSPAFKRKSLQVYTPSSLSKESTPERLFSERTESFSKLNDKISKPRTLYEANDLRGRMTTSLLTPKTLISNNSTNIPKKYYKDILNYVRDYQNVEIKICTTTDIIDSDNDSAMSSTQSSYRSSASSPLQTIENGESDSSRLSPRLSHYTAYSMVKTETPIKKISTEKRSDEYVKRNVCRSMSSDTNVSLSSSAGSAATSGSQASCSSLESSVADSDKRKVSKTYDIDTINRRNILASAKCRSGRDAKLKSPVIETKFSHESCDRPPSPVLKTSERLSTLTPSVSAISNKGENRRRNKIIAETDSDSDSDVNIRQRKSDFKNTRLKRNSSSSNKNKQNDTSPESPKSEDAPKIISEKIIREIKKAGLDNFISSRPVILPEKNGYDIKKTEIPHTETVKKEDKLIKTTEVKQNQKVETVCEKDKLTAEKEKPLSQLSKRNELSEIKTEISVAKEVKVPTRTIRLRRGAGTGVGVILAGGIDCEAKDVTVHRILADSVAAKAGLKRGAKVTSINGHTMTGLTHAQSVTILKDQRSEVVMEIESETQENAIKVGCGSEKAESKDRQIEAEKGADAGDKASSIVTVLLEKAGGGAGLGFGLDGGRDSPRGDHPLTIKKLFAGGAAAQSGRVLVGAELLSAGGQSMESFTRTQAWAALKALPAGPVRLVLRNPKGSKHS